MQSRVAILGLAGGLLLGMWSVVSAAEVAGEAPSENLQSPEVSELIERHAEFLSAQGEKRKLVDDSAGPARSAAMWFTTMDQLDDEHVLSPGDVVSFRVIEDRDDPVQIEISATGDLDIPYIGRVRAKSQTCRQLAEVVKVRLEERYYHQATVILAVDAVSLVKGRAYIVGSVRATGAINIPSTGEFTVARAVLQAGGFSEFADMRKVKLMRKNPPDAEESYQQITVNVEQILEKGRLDLDVPVQPDDLIYVPSRMINF